MGEEVSAHYTGRRSFLKDGRHNENGFVASNRFFLFSIEFNLNSIFPLFFFFFALYLGFEFATSVPHKCRGEGDNVNHLTREIGRIRGISRTFRI